MSWVLHNFLGVLRNDLGVLQNTISVLLNVLGPQHLVYIIGSMGCKGGADRTFACKSQECLWQDWYIFLS